MKIQQHILFYYSVLSLSISSTYKPFVKANLKIYFIEKSAPPPLAGYLIVASGIIKKQN